MKVEKTIARYEEALAEAVKGFKSMLAALAKAVSQEKAGRAVKQQKKVTDGQQKLKTFVKDLYRRSTRLDAKAPLSTDFFETTFAHSLKIGHEPFKLGGANTHADVPFFVKEVSCPS